MLRARHRRPLPDVLQAAAAMRSARPVIVTSDRAFRKIEEVDLFLLDELAG